MPRLLAEPHRRLRRRAGGAALLALAALAATGCRAQAPTDRARVSGHVEADDVQLAAEVGGRILELNLAEGDRVTAGQVIARLDTRDAELAIARLRAKLKYRPVVFELLPDEFTLTELQRTVEAISGRHLHKQNFRRLVESAALVEPTGETSTATGGRPAALFRFRREVIQERPAPGLRVGRRSS